MDDELRAKLENRGTNLRASHDDSIIADVIGEVERLESENAEITAKMLRIMVQNDH